MSSPSQQPATHNTAAPLADATERRPSQCCIINFTPCIHQSPLFHQKACLATPTSQASPVTGSNSGKGPRYSAQIRLSSCHFAQLATRIRCTGGSPPKPLALCPRALPMPWSDGTPDRSTRRAQTSALGHTLSLRSCPPVRHISTPHQHATSARRPNVRAWLVLFLVTPPAEAGLQRGVWNRSQRTPEILLVARDAAGLVYCNSTNIWPCADHACSLPTKRKSRSQLQQTSS